MYYKLIDDYTISSSAVERKTPDGRPVSNFTAWLEAQSPDYRLAHGWRVLRLPVQESTESGEPGEPGEELPPSDKRYRMRYSIDCDDIVGVYGEYVPPVVPFNMLKTALRANMEAAGLVAMLDAYLQSDPKIKQVWDEAIVIESDSPLIAAAMDAMESAGLKTREELVAIMEASRTTLQV